MTPPLPPPLKVLWDMDDTVMASCDAIIKKADQACVEPHPIGLSDKDWPKWTDGDLEPLHGKKLRPGVPLLSGKPSEETHFMDGQEDRDGIGVFELKTLDLLQQIQPLPGAKEAIAAIASEPEKIDNFFVTANYPPQQEKQEEVWKTGVVAEHFPALKGKLHFNHNKTIYNADVIIDDGAHNIRKFLTAAQPGTVVAIMIHRQCNAREQIEGMIRVDDAPAAAFLVAQIAEQRRRDYAGIARFPGGDPALCIKIEPPQNVK